ncbi:MAG: outer membrane protein assembly factor BamA [Phycisphaerae bacterium]
MAPLMGAASLAWLIAAPTEAQSPSEPASWLLTASAQPASDVAAGEGALVERVEFQGLNRINEGFVRRLIKSREGQPFSTRQLQEDVRELLRSRKFLNAAGSTRAEGDRAVVIFTVAEKPEIAGVEIVGNKRFTTEALFKELPFAAGSVLDRFEVNKGRDDLLRKYKETGHFYAEVKLDDAALDEGRVVYTITEGPEVHVAQIAFEGNRAFAASVLRTKIKTQKRFWFIISGVFDEEQAERDALAVEQFYRDEGFLDAKVGYRPDFDPITREALTLTFVIEEGARYTVQAITVAGNAAFDTPRLLSEMQLAPGGFAREDTRRRDIRRVQDVYGEIGYVDARIDTQYDFTETPGVVVLRYDIAENKRSKFGRITIRGNTTTKDEVIRRELRFYPGEDYNTVAARRAERRVLETTLFTPGGVKITPLEDVDGYREALVEVTEGNMIDFLIGVGVSSDNGLIGNITVNNRNFDLLDWPRTWGEFFRGRAFRGDGQTLRLSLEPGVEVSRFRIDFTEPYLFDKPLRFDTAFFLFERDRGPYTEERLGGNVSLSRRFETGPLNGWAVEGAVGLEGVDITDVKTFAAKAIRDARGSSTLTTLKGTIVRDTTDSRIQPSEGSRLSVSWEQAGALGGDWDFGRPGASARWYRTVRTDILDRKSILSLRGDIGYIVGDAPVFERFYAGGFGSLRGFDFRGVSPRKGVYDDAVGGDFILLTGAEYSVPLYAETVRGVTFIDMGTVEEDFEITNWRVSVGFGIRINLDFFGRIPMIFDFGFPIAKDDDDATRVFNFSFGASF